ncbi:MAG: tRNA-dihydrouridine synthase [Pseudomonadota bacterium]
MLPPNRPRSLDIGGLTIAPALLLAPMEGLTDVPFRRVVRRLGGLGLTCTEFVPSEGLIRSIPRVREAALLDDDEHPGAIQIYGRRPEAMADAALAAVDLGADLVDLNMGCPAKKVCAHSGGASLLREPDLVRAIVRAVRHAIPGPLTVKIRTGWTPEARNGPEIARICEGEGADALIVHWRTREEAFRGPMDPAPVAAVVRAVSIPVVGNGDVLDVPSAARMLDESGCHGLMLGRGVVRNPWLPAQLAAWLEGRPPPEPSLQERLAMLEAYVAQQVATCHTERGALGRAKGFCGYYTRGLPHGGALREAVFHSQSVSELLAHVAEHFARLAEALGLRD